MSYRHRLYSWQNRDLWPDLIREALICSWRGHNFARPKMYDMVCTRCSVSRPR